MGEARKYQSGVRVRASSACRCPHLQEEKIYGSCFRYLLVDSFSFFRLLELASPTDQVGVRPLRGSFAVVLSTRSDCPGSV